MINLENIFNSHYSTDKLLIFSLNIEHYSLNNSASTIVKCGKELIKYKGKSLEEIFPMKLRKKGIEKLIKLMLKNKQNNPTIFEYIFN